MNIQKKNNVNEFIRHVSELYITNPNNIADVETKFEMTDFCEKDLVNITKMCQEQLQHLNCAKAKNADTLIDEMDRQTSTIELLENIRMAIDDLRRERYDITELIDYYTRLSKHVDERLDDDDVIDD